MAVETAPITRIANLQSGIDENGLEILLNQRFVWKLLLWCYEISSFPFEFKRVCDMTSSTKCT